MPKANKYFLIFLTITYLLPPRGENSAIFFGRKKFDFFGENDGGFFCQLFHQSRVRQVYLAIRGFFVNNRSQIFVKNCTSQKNKDENWRNHNHLWSTPCHRMFLHIAKHLFGPKKTLWFSTLRIKTHTSKGKILNLKKWDFRDETKMTWFLFSFQKPPQKYNHCPPPWSSLLAA